MTNEEKILEMLTGLAETVSQQGKLLAKLTEDVSELKETAVELDERSLRSAVLQEGDIAPKVQLLLEGQAHLRDTLTPQKRTKKIEDKIVFLESVVKSHAERLAALEKAQ